ncbi:MAG: SIS domain-containing protein [Oscillospiraceae bacterium]|nr:SIS domain-containing protein [Oscillospiraceae bacterium]
MRATSVSLFEDLFIRYPQLKKCRTQLFDAAACLTGCFQSGGKLLICGNGGSASDAAHIVGELMKNFMLDRPVGDEFRRKLLEKTPETGNLIADRLQGALPAIALTQENALISAYANDAYPELAYAQQVYGYGESGDTLLCISTSGNSENIVNAAVVAVAKDLHTIALTGETPSRLSAVCDLSIQVPETGTHRIQELHLPVYHCLCAVLEQEFFG